MAGVLASIPATCAPRCTRTRFPARTSATGPNPPPACPAIVALIEGDQPERSLRRQGGVVMRRRRRTPSVDLPPSLPLGVPTRRRPRRPRAAGSAGARRPRRRAPDGVPGRRRPGARPLHRSARTCCRPGDLVVVNTSATVPAAIDATLVDGTARPVRAPRLDRTAGRAVDGRAAIADRRWVDRSAGARRRPAPAPSPRRRRRRSTCSARRPGHAGCGSPCRATTASTCSPCSGGAAGRSAIRTSSATGRSTPTRRCSPPSRAAPRCRARPGRSPPRS